MHLEDCLGADAPAVRRILAAELGDLLVQVEQGNGEVAPDAVVARTDCGVESSIVVVSHARGVRFERRVELAHVSANARTRLLALSMAELVASAFAALDALPPEPEPEAEPEAEPEPELVVEPPRARFRVLTDPEPLPPAPPERPIGIRLIGVARVSGSPAHVSGGGGVGLEVGLPFSLGLGADLRYEQGEADVGPLGRVTLRVAWGSLLALARPVVGWSSVSVGAGAKLGVAWLEGMAGEVGVAARTHSGFVAGPTIVGHVALHLAGSGYVHLGLELSWITVGLVGVDGASGQPLASFAGPQLAITAGFEIQPSR